jgi:endonuclease/exonuclease/phosphatase family metal-dependent hydrolase
VLQESNTEVNAVVAAALPGFAKRESTQFFLASRWPIHVFHEPSELTIGGHQRSPRFVYATLGSPLGPLDVFILHPISPRDALDDARALAREPGQAAGVRRTTADNTALRRLQVRTAAALAAASKNPVILAGDTNLPGSSALLAELLERWQDGFDAVGRGFGYTFPVGRRGAWMRIDRILASRQLRFLTFAVGRGRGSDHRAVWADLELRAAPAPRSTPGGATSTEPSARDAATAQ